MVKVRTADNGPPKEGQVKANAVQRLKMNIAGLAPSLQNQYFKNQDHIQDVINKAEAAAAAFKVRYHEKIASGERPEAWCTCAAPAHHSCRHDAMMHMMPAAHLLP
jgi:hypothetical protein